MRLRERMAFTTVTGALVLVTTLYLSTDALRKHDADLTLEQAISTAMTPELRAQCAERPEAFGGGALEPLPAPTVMGDPGEEFRSRPQLFAYSDAGVSANPDAPPFPAALKVVLQSETTRAGAMFPAPGGLGRELALRLQDAGPCAVVLGRFGAFVVPFQTEMTRLAILTGIFIFASLLAASPVVTRVRRLSAAVKASSNATYAVAVPVTGSDEIGELEAEFNRAGDQVKSYIATVEARETTLRTVVTNTAHDVALPLIVLQGHLSRMQSHLVASATAEGELRSAIRETHYLAALLHNLGTAARLDSPNPIIERRPLDISAPIERVVARHLQLAQTLEVELISSVPPQPLPVNIDITLIEQAATNLVHNAILYNKPGGHVAVVVEPTDEGRRFSLRVRDDGPGIAPEERAHLTERSFRGSVGKDRRPDGQGLGLAIVKEVVQRHEFTLDIHEVEGGGTEFEVTGPCVASATAGA